MKTNNTTTRSPTSRRDWIRFSDGNNRCAPSLPSKTSKGESGNREDDQTVDSAVQGRSVNVEKGISGIV